MFALFGTGLLAVDVAKVWYHESRLQDAADAAALAGAASIIDGNWQSRVNAILAESTETGFTPTKIADGTEQGWWTFDTRVFTSAEDLTIEQRQAVRVRLTSDVSLLFGPLFGIDTVAVKAQAVAVPELPLNKRHLYYALLGSQSIEADGTADFDSYNSKERRTFPNSNGSGDRDFAGGTNGTVTLQSGVEIWGDFFSSPTSTTSINSSMFKSGGKQEAIDYEIKFEQPTVPGNAREIGHLSIGSGSHALPGGTYVADSLNLGSAADISLLGPVTLYLRGPARISGKVSTYDSLPENLKIIQTTSDDLIIDKPYSGGSEHVMLADLYNPNGLIQLDGKVDFYGRLWADQIKLTAGSDFFSDTNLTRKVSAHFKSAKLVK